MKFLLICAVLTSGISAAEPKGHEQFNEDEFVPGTYSLKDAQAHENYHNDGNDVVSPGYTDWFETNPPGYHKMMERTAMADSASWIPVTEMHPAADGERDYTTS